MMTTDTQIRTPFRQLMRVGAAAVLALGLAACGGSSSKPDGGGGGTPAVEKTAYDKAVDAIAAATTDADVDKAVTDATPDVDGTELTKLQAEATKRKAAIKKMVRTDAQKKALMDALAEVDTSDLSDADKIAAAKAKIAALQAALDAAADVTDADKKPYQDRRAAAQTAVDRKEQMNELSEASKALRTALNAFSGATATKEQLTAARTALTRLTDALAAAEDLTDAEKDMYQRQAKEADEENGPLKVAEGRLKAHVVQMITDGEIAAAKAAVDMVTDTSPETTVTDAQAKINAAKKRINEANILVAQKATLRQALAMHEGALGRAIASRGIATRVQGIKDGPIMEAKEKVGMLKRDSSREDWAAAEEKVAAAKKTIADADIPAADKTRLLAELKTHEDKHAAAVVSRKAYAKAMHAALEGPNDDGSDNALDNLAAVADQQTRSQTDRRPVGLKLDPADGAGSLPTGNHGDFVLIGVKAHTTPTVGMWAVTEQTNGVATADGAPIPAFNDRARVYSNRKMRTVDFDEAAKRTSTTVGPVGVPEWTTSRVGTYDAEKRIVKLNADSNPAVSTTVRETASPQFPTVGNKEFEPERGTKEIVVPGTYRGAAGNYRCISTGVGTCTVGKVVGGYSFDVAWQFEPAAGAKIKYLDLNYAYFGWWVRESSADGMPKVVAPFFGVEGGGIEEVSGTSGFFGGSATYEGPAAGVYAIHDPLDDKGEAGEFTATARLRAVLSGSTTTAPDRGVTGTISEFKLNGGSGDPGWKVELLNGARGTGNLGVPIAKSPTRWTIKGLPGAQVTDAWTGQMYDTNKTSTSSGGDDGIDAPDLVLGTFYSEHGETHRMTGAFAAERE